MKKLAAFLFIITFSAQAQYEDVQAVHSFLDLRSFMSFDVTVNGQGLSYVFGVNDDLSVGILKNNVFRVTVKSNQLWQLNISSETPYFNRLKTGMASSIPASALRFRRENRTNFVTLGVNQQAIATGNRGGSNSRDNNFMLDMLASPGNASESGEFIINVLFTLTTQ